MHFWYLILAGLIGAGIKSYISNDQATFSKESIGDVVIGGIAGGLFPLLVPILPDVVGGLWGKASANQQILLVCGLAFTSSNLVTDALQKLGLLQNLLNPARLLAKKEEPKS